eukprot:978366-Rhodomonas_salina.1
MKREAEKVRACQGQIKFLKGEAKTAFEEAAACEINEIKVATTSPLHAASFLTVFAGLTAVVAAGLGGGEAAPRGLQVCVGSPKEKGLRAAVAAAVQRTVVTWVACIQTASEIKPLVPSGPEQDRHVRCARRRGLDGNEHVRVHVHEGSCHTLLGSLCVLRR